MDVTGTVCIAEVDESGVDHLVFLTFVQEVLQVAEMSVAAPHSVASTVLVQQEHLARREPTLTAQWSLIHDIHFYGILSYMISLI